MSVTNDVDLGRIALLEAIQHQGRSGMSLRHATASVIRIHRGKPV